MKMVDLYGYGTAWYVMTGVLVLASLLVIVLKKSVQKEN
jgi:hypothetical protein